METCYANIMIASNKNGVSYLNMFLMESGHMSLEKNAFQMINFQTEQESYC